MNKKLIFNFLLLTFSIMIISNGLLLVLRQLGIFINDHIWLYVPCRIKNGEELSLTEESCLPELKQIIRDTAICIEHILLEAESIGLSSCWTANFVQDDIRPILDIPKDKYVVGIVTIGYSDDTGGASNRRSLASMIRYEK